MFCLLSPKQKSKRLCQALRLKTESLPSASASLPHPPHSLLIETLCQQDAPARPFLSFVALLLSPAVFCVLAPLSCEYIPLSILVEAVLWAL